MFLFARMLLRLPGEILSDKAELTAEVARPTRNAAVASMRTTSHDTSRDQDTRAKQQRLAANEGEGPPRRPPGSKSCAAM